MVWGALKGSFRYPPSFSHLSFPAAKSLQSCATLQPHRRQPTRLPHPWDSPGKNTGVGCHFLLQSRKVKSEREVAQSCPTLSDPMDCSLPGSSVHGIFQARVLEWVASAISSPGDLPNIGIKPKSLGFPAWQEIFPGFPGKPHLSKSGIEMKLRMYWTVLYPVY